MRLLAIGDIAWDIVVQPSGELVWGSDVYGTTDLLPGGSSANVAVWATRLGAKAVLVGKVGDDRLGELMRSHLASERVASHVIVEPGSATTRIAVVLARDGEHAFVTDHSNPLRLRNGDLPPTLVEGADAVFLNGYAVFMAGSATFAASLLEEARRRQRPVAFDPSSFTLIRRYGANRLLDGLGPLDVLLGNEEELDALSEGRGAAALLERARLVVIKQGAKGAAALQREFGSGGVRQWTAPADPVRVVDTTGAGDAFDAAFLVEYVNRGDLSGALAAANRLGGRVAAALGAQP
jgi:ribokinase